MTIAFDALYLPSACFFFLSMVVGLSLLCMAILKGETKMAWLVVIMILLSWVTVYMLVHAYPVVLPTEAKLL